MVRERKNRSQTSADAPLSRLDLSVSFFPVLLRVLVVANDTEGTYISHPAPVHPARIFCISDATPLDRIERRGGFVGLPLVGLTP